METETNRTADGRAAARQAEAALQQKLVWPNIAILVIALTAGLALLFGP